MQANWTDADRKRARIAHDRLAGDSDACVECFQHQAAHDDAALTARAKCSLDEFAHFAAFVIRERLSMCVRHERWPLGEVGWEREERMGGEPRRVRCLRCQELLAHPDNGVLMEEP